MEIIKVPDGQTEQSFRKVKITNVERTIEMFSCILDDNECFSSEFQINVLALQLQLQTMLERLEGKIQ